MAQNKIAVKEGGEAMFIPVGEAARQSLERLLDELVDMQRTLPDGETKRQINQQINELDELLMAKSAL